MGSSRYAVTGGARFIEDYWDDDVPASQLTGQLERHTGHGRFVAGVVQQAAPSADGRVMAGRGVAYESDLLATPKKMVEQVRATQAPRGNRSPTSAGRGGANQHLASRPSRSSRARGR